MWNLSLFREVNLFHRKIPTVPALWNIMKFQHFFKVHQLSSNLQNILESSSETCMWNLSLFIEVNFFHRKMLKLPALQNIMKFQHFFKVHQISSNLQNLLESSSETCMWNLSLFREVKFFHRKRLTVTALEIWNFIFFKTHLISSNMQNILESSSETFKWNSRPFREVKFYQRKMPTVPALEILSNFNIYSKFTKFHQTCRTYWNHHQKHACEIRAHSEKLTYFKEKCRQCRPFEISWNFNIFFKIHLISSNL